MNLDHLQERLDTREAELNEVRKQPYGYLKVAKRLKKIERIRGRISARQILLSQRQRDSVALARRERFRTQVQIAHRNLVSANKRFMSIDVERLPSGQFHEIGITMIQGTSVESFNYRLKGIERGPQFIFGKTIEASFDIIKNLVLLHASGADAYIGHSIRFDLKHLTEEGIDLPRRFFYDTAEWAKVFHGYVPSLYYLTQMYGVGSQQFHCGGNDARYTGEVFVKMVHTHIDEFR